MSKTPIKLAIDAAHDGIGLKVFDYLLASSIDGDGAPLAISLNPQSADHDIRVLFITPDSRIDPQILDRYDAVFFSNNDEPLTVTYPTMIAHARKKNTWIISNSFLTLDHSLADKVIFANNDSLICRQYWTNGIFPQYHLNQRSKNIRRDGNLVFINGANRSWRWHYLTQIQSRIPAVDLISNISSVIHETNDAAWESDQDQKFRIMVNEIYPIERNVSTAYYDQSTSLQFLSRSDGLPVSATIPPGYFIMPEYWRYRCVIFPESNWLNNELSMTEKVFKCFFAGALPFPIGGAHIHRLYDQLGFMTAWHFLPDELQTFDAVLDHHERSLLTVEAIAWLSDNAEILAGDRVQKALKHNRLKFLCNDLDHYCTTQLHQIVQSILTKKRNDHGNP